MAVTAIPAIWTSLNLGSASNFLSMQLSYESGGKQIPVDTFAPAGGGAHPAVIVLHGSGGMWNPMYMQYAEQFSRLGYAVYVFHYFERTGTQWADDATIEKHFVEWMETIRSGMEMVARQPGIDGSRMAIIGFSLGAFLGLAVAAREPRIRAVVDFFGGMPEELRNKCTRMPPVLILHGDADERVPLRWATELEELLKRCGTEYDIKVYRGEGHRFGMMTMLDAGARTVKFLKKYLG
jgi:carboxymethylenebutenolidase